MDSQIKEVLQKHFSPAEISEIEEFLDRDFLRAGQISIATVFLYANESGKTAREVLRECEKEWKRCWELQHPELKGNLDAPGAAGTQNFASLRNIYRALGVKAPFEK